jgi:hypothetical protein
VRNEDDFERFRRELRWLANDWERRSREATDRWPAPGPDKMAGQLRSLAEWDLTKRRHGPWSGIDWISGTHIQETS